MATKIQNSFRRLKLLYLIVFVVGAIIIAPTHIFPIPTFMYARFPHYLEMMKPYFGVSWPTTFEIYHYVLYALGIIVSLNVLGIIFTKFNKIALFSSLIGIFLISSMVLFFFFVFAHVNFQTSLIYGPYLVILLIIDFLTFKALRNK